MSRHSNSLYIWLLLLLFCLVFSQPIYSKINIEYQGQVFSLDLPTIKVNGDNYISVENLFKQIGGVEYYSPIMKKVNLFFGGKNWVLSLDKGIAVAESGEEIPLGRSVVIQENSVYISPQFLNQLFGISTDTSSTVVTPSPSTTKHLQQSHRLPFLLEARHSLMFGLIPMVMKIAQGLLLILGLTYQLIPCKPTKPTTALF